MRAGAVAPERIAAAPDTSDVLAVAATLRWERPDLTAQLADHVLGAAGNRDRWLIAAGWFVHARAAIGDGRAVAATVLDGTRRLGASGLAAPAAQRLRIELALVAIGTGQIDRARALLAPVVTAGTSPLLRAEARLAVARCAVEDAPGDAAAELRNARASWSEVTDLHANPGLASTDLIEAAAHRRGGRPDACAAAANAGLDRLSGRGPGGAPSTPALYLAAALSTEWISALLDTGRIDEAHLRCEALFTWLGEPLRPSRQLARLRLTVARALAPAVPPRDTVAALQKAARDATDSDAPDLEVLSQSALAVVLQELGQHTAADAAVQQAHLAERRDKQRDQLFRAGLGKATLPTANEPPTTRPTSSGSARPWANGGEPGARPPAAPLGRTSRDVLAPPHRTDGATGDAAPGPAAVAPHASPGPRPANASPPDRNAAPAEATTPSPDPEAAGGASSSERDRAAGQRAPEEHPEPVEPTAPSRPMVDQWPWVEVSLSDDWAEEEIGGGPAGATTDRAAAGAEGRSDPPPTAAEPVAGGSSAGDSVASRPVAERPVDGKPVAAGLVAGYAGVEHSDALPPVAAPPVGDDSTAASPLAGEVSARGPVATRPAAVESVAALPLAAGPVAADRGAGTSAAAGPVAGSPVATGRVAGDLGAVGARPVAGLPAAVEPGAARPVAAGLVVGDLSSGDLVVGGPEPGDPVAGPSSPAEPTAGDPGERSSAVGAPVAGPLVAAELGSDRPLAANGVAGNPGAGDSSARTPTPGQPTAQKPVAAAAQVGREAADRDDQPLDWPWAGRPGESPIADLLIERMRVNKRSDGPRDGWGAHHAAAGDPVPADGPDLAEPGRADADGAVPILDRPHPILDRPAPARDRLASAPDPPLSEPPTTDREHRSADRLRLVGPGTAAGTTGTPAAAEVPSRAPRAPDNPWTSGRWGSSGRPSAGEPTGRTGPVDRVGSGSRARNAVEPADTGSTRPLADHRESDEAPRPVDRSAEIGADATPASAGNGELGPGSTAHPALGADPGWTGAAPERAPARPADATPEACRITIDVARDGRRFAGPRAAAVLRTVAGRLHVQLPVGARLTADGQSGLTIQLPTWGHAAAAAWMHQALPGLLDDILVDEDLARLHLRSVIAGADGPVGAQLLVRLDQAGGCPTESPGAETPIAGRSGTDDDAATPGGRHDATGRAPFRPPGDRPTNGGRRRRREPGTAEPPARDTSDRPETPASTAGLGLADLLAGALAAYRGI